MKVTVYPLSGLHCQSCVQRITAALQPFAASVTVTLAPMQVRFEALRPDVTLASLQAALAALGNYSISDPTSLAQNHTPDGSEMLPRVASSAARDIQDGSQRLASGASWLQTYRPLILLVVFIGIASVLVQVGQGVVVSVQETMRLFMAGFFLAFAFFKLLDLGAFAKAYANYDLLAAQWQAWGYVYPFVELGLGLAYLANWQPTWTYWATLVVMGVSAIGVIRAVRAQRPIRCACLGTVFQLPMSTVTIIEDVGMVAMAAWMLAM